MKNKPEQGITTYNLIYTRSNLQVRSNVKTAYIDTLHCL